MMNFLSLFLLFTSFNFVFYCVEFFDILMRFDGFDGRISLFTVPPTLHPALRPWRGKRLDAATEGMDGYVKEVLRAGTGT